MNFLELHTDLPLEYSPQMDDYNAGFAHGAVSSGICILFLWTLVWRCMQERPRTV